MKKSELKKLALLGITGGLMMSAQSASAEIDLTNAAGQMLAAGGCGGKSGCGNHSGGGSPSKQYGRMEQNTMTAENNFVAKLDSSHRQMYYSMDQAGRDLARKMADDNQYDPNQAVEAAKKQMNQQGNDQNQTSWRNPTRSAPRHF